MPDKPGLLTRLRISVRALLLEHWKGQAGQRFRETVNTVSEFTKEHVKPGERLKEAPDMLWDTLKEKSSRTGVNLADEEQKRIASELARRTLEDKARQESAIADRLETEARMAKIQEQQTRLDFVEKLRKINVVPVWDARGSMIFAKAPTDYDWDGLTSRLLQARDLQLPDAGAALKTTFTFSREDVSFLRQTGVTRFEGDQPSAPDTGVKDEILPPSEG